MYAIVETGSKQYKIKSGDLLTIEKIEGSVGSEVVLSKVLMVHDKEPVWGNPYIEKAQVLCKILTQDRGPKLITFKLKRRKGSRRKMGHRQSLTWIKVEAISLSGITAKPNVQPEKSAKEKAPEKKKVTRSISHPKVSLGSHSRQNEGSPEKKSKRPSAKKEEK